MARSRLIQLLGLTLLLSACSKDDEDCASEGAAACTVSVTDGTTPLVQDLAPLPGEGPTFSGITTAGYTVSWTAAIDSVTSASKLEYRLIKASTPEEIDSLSEAMASDAIIMDWTVATLSKAIVEADPQAAAYAVLVRDAVMNIAWYPPQTLSTGGPVAGTALTFSAVTESGFTVSWGAATSASSAAENLEYRVIRAAGVAAIDTVAEAEAASSVVLDWTKNVFSAQVTGVTANTTIAVAVLVRDERGRITLYTPQTVRSTPHRVIFKTNTQYASTQLAPSSNADARCNADAAKPTGRGTFKALISGSDRIACTTANCSGGAAEHLDWIMEANRTYENVSGQELWTTNAAGIVILTAPHPPIYANSNQFIWTGFDAGWVKAALNCSNWTTVSSGVNGRVGTANASNDATWTSFHQDCSQVAAIYCVEQ